MRSAIQRIDSRYSRWRAPLVAMLVVAGLLSLGWRWLDGRLEAESRRQASRGASPAVVALRDDWIATILPIALGEGGPAAERARRVATGRIDRLISEKNGPNAEELLATASEMFAFIEQLEPMPTDRAVEWGVWACGRLTSAAPNLAPRDRLQLLAKADQATSSLLDRASRRSPQPIQPPIVARIAEPPRVKDTPAPTEPEWVKPLPLGVLPVPAVVADVAEPDRKEATREPPVWNPKWGRADKFDEGEPLAAFPPAEEGDPETERAPKRIPDWTSRELLAELVRIAALLPPPSRMPSAAGPASMRSESSDDPLVELRSQFSALQTELAARGFRAVTEGQVMALLSDDAKVREELVPQLMVDRTGSAARLLLILASDPAVEVRAAAISVLGSSPRKPWVRLAWELAMKDEAPEVGRLAEGLRARLR